MRLHLLLAVARAHPMVPAVKGSCNRKEAEQIENGDDEKVFLEAVEGLHFSAPFQKHNWNSQQNTGEEYQQKRQESNQEKLNNNADYRDPE